MVPASCVRRSASRGKICRISARRADGDLVRGLLIGADPQVLLHCEFGEHLAPLGNASDAGGDDLVRWQLRDVDAVEHDAAGAWRRQPEDRPHQGRLAGAIRAEQAGDAAVLDLERDALQHVGLVIGRKDTLDRERAGHHATPR